MRALLLVLAVLASHFGTPPGSAAQTRGIGDVVLVESKAAKIDANRAAVLRHQAEIVNLDAAWKDRVRKLRDEVAELHRELAGHLHDLRNGYYCSECGRSKTQLEKQGIVFAVHLRDVRGRAVPASPERLEQVRREYAQKIASKQAQLDREEAGDPQIASKKRAIVEMENETPRLCSEIAAHGRSYESKVLAEAKSDQRGWAENLMSHISDILIAEDKIVIYQARKVAYDRDFSKAAEAARERVKQENLRQQEELKGQMKSLQADLERLRVSSEERARDWSARMGELRTELSRLETELKRNGLSQDTRESLTAGETRMKEELATLQQNLLELKNRFDAESTRVTVETQRLQGEIWQLGSNLSRQQEEAVAKLRSTVEQRKAATDALIANARAAVQNGNAAFQAKADLYRGRVTRYHELVSQESDRMMAAGGRVGCPVSNDARGHVVLNWNKLYPCVSAHLMAKPRTGDVFGSYCTGETSTLGFLSTYRQFLGGLNEEDLRVVKNSSNSTWYERVMSP